MPAKKKAVAEEHLKPTLEESASKYRLFRAEERDEFRCAFCPNPIVADQDYQLIILPNAVPRRTKRRVHVDCVVMALQKLIVMRDEKGKSEDL